MFTYAFDFFIKKFRVPVLLRHWIYTPSILLSTALRCHVSVRFEVKLGMYVSLKEHTIVIVNPLILPHNL